MENISKQASIMSLLFVVTIATSLKTNNEELHSLPLPLTTQSPSHAPSPSPSHHSHHHHHPHPHSPSPQPPAKPPTSTSHPPVKAPSAAPIPLVKRKFVAVQGIIYCKNNCSFSGINTLFGASPLPGARVILRCRNTEYILRKTATTDKNGYFFLEAPPLVTTYGAHKCKVYLAHHKPNGTSTGAHCSSPTDLNSGSSGAYLFSNNTGPPTALPTFSLFSVGPFAYESTKCFKH